MITNFNLTIFLIIPFIKVNIFAWLYIIRLHFNCSMKCIVVFISLLCHLIYQYIHFLILKSYICKFHFLMSNKSFCNNRFSFIICWIHFFIIILKPWFYWSTVKFIVFVYQYFVWFAIRLIKRFWEGLVLVINFCIFLRNNPHIFTININNT